MIPLSSSSDCGFDGGWWWHRRHSFEVSLLQHAGVKLRVSLVWLPNFPTCPLTRLTISFTCEFSASSSSYSVLRQTFGVVGASGKSDIDSDFSNISLEPTGGLFWLIFVNGCLSTLSELLIEFSLSSSDTSSSSSSFSVSTHSAVISFEGFAMGVCMTTRISSILSSASHLWFIHSVTSRRSLKSNKISLSTSVLVCI